MIGDDIEVRVLSSDGVKVRLGITAPSEVPVHRTEIYLQIQSQEHGDSAEEQALGVRAQRSRGA